MSNRATRIDGYWSVRRDRRVQGYDRLSPAQREVVYGLLHLRGQGLDGVTVQAVASETGVTALEAEATLTGLARMGLVERVAQPGRSGVWRLT